MTDTQLFQQKIQSVFQRRLHRHREAVPANECIRIDLHCHDCNSDVTDELFGRILRFPETWLQTDTLVACLAENRCNAVTITNHNNARSCWDLLERGQDVLPGAEFTCYFKTFNTHLHVLAYGFTPAQEETLKKLRNDIFAFLAYAADQDIPDQLPRPLYVHARNGRPGPAMFEQLVLLFDRFEVLNGQRDVWQNLLIWEWLDSLTEEQIDIWQKKHGIRAGDFCRSVYKKQVTGGSDDHMGRFAFPSYPDQMFHVPDLLAVQHLFLQGGYDRIICSTELVMALAALFLKQSMAVPVYFFMHTDWMEFFKYTTELSPPVLDRIRRTLRALYHQFDGIFVLNREHQDWLTGPAIAYDVARVYKTAHWVDDIYYPRPGDRQTFFQGQVSETDIVLLYAGRLSEEKGVFDLPKILVQLKETATNVKMVIAGTGPAEKRLQKQLPEAVFLGWVDKKQMPELYSRVDLLVLPSRFDTFGNVILEAMSCGAAVAAYAEKGPLDIIQTQENGILAEDITGMAAGIACFIRDADLRCQLKENSLVRAKAFSAEAIFQQFLLHLGLADAAAGPCFENAGQALKKSHAA